MGELGEDGAAARGLLLTVGFVQGAHGVRGAVRVRSCMSEPASLASYDTWWLKTPQAPETAWRQYGVRHAQWHRQAVVASLEGCDDRDTAARLTGCQVALERGLLPPLAEGEYYWNDLLGLTVANVDGLILGTVARIIATGANDCLEVHGPGTVIMVPFLWQTVILAVDQASRHITVDWKPFEEAADQPP